LSYSSLLFAVEAVLNITTFDIKTPLRFDDFNENPSYVFASLHPTYLNCKVNFHPDHKLLDDLDDPFYPGIFDEEIDDYDDNVKDEDAEKGYDNQNKIYSRNDTLPHTSELAKRSKRAKHNNASKLKSTSEDYYDTEDSESAKEAAKLYDEQHQRYNQQNQTKTARVKRSTHEKVDFFYEWFKDDVIVNTTSENETEKRFVLFEHNGTLKISTSSDSAGRYYCKVKAAVKLELKTVTLGPIISRSTLVEVASE
jgi:hypothetical protein